jgi:4-hydroxythreonine-4-phosphate dehydrogenase
VSTCGSATSALVLADDRTGALETAGMVADRCGGPVTVDVVGGDPPPAARVTVTDLASRHLEVPAAVARVAAAHVGRRATAQLHKIDSTLRGNWAEELVARRGLLGLRRVLVVPAFPAVRRVCRDGTVHADGLPVAEGPAGRDARRPVTSSRPADHLARAGADRVVELADRAEVEAWLELDEAGFAVADADTETAVDQLAAAWAVWHHSVLFAGPAGSVAAAAGHLFGRAEDVSAMPGLVSVVVVNGSLHEGARRQVMELRRAIASGELRGIDLIESPAPHRLPVAAAEAASAASLLASEARRSEAGCMVIIGGDTAAAVLGDAPMLVLGTVAPGMPWGTDARGRVVITRSGGFGSDGSLLELLAGRMPT